MPKTASKRLVFPHCLPMRQKTIDAVTQFCSANLCTRDELISIGVRLADDMFQSDFEALLIAVRAENQAEKRSTASSRSDSPLRVERSLT
jgi:hypothetical protein